MKALPSITLVLGLTSCFQGENRQFQGPEYYGSRVININLNMPKAEISVYGAFMSTPDQSLIKTKVKEFADAGEIDNVIEHTPGTEGGATYCFHFSENGDKQGVYSYFETLSTDKKETNYKVISVKDCTSLPE